MASRGIRKTGIASAVRVMLGLGMTACSGQGDSTGVSHGQNLGVGTRIRAEVVSEVDGRLLGLDEFIRCPKPAARVTIGSVGDILVHASVRDDAAKNAKNAGGRGI